MTSIAPNSQPSNYTHMFDIPDLRGKLPKMESNKVLTIPENGVYVCKETISGVINTHPDFKRFKYILKLSGLEGIYGDIQTNRTIFVGSDMFLNKKISENIYTNMDRATARNIIIGGSLNRRIPSSILNDSPASYFNTIDPNNRILITNNLDNIKLNSNINVIHKDIICANGIIHVIDNLLIPTIV